MESSIRYGECENCFKEAVLTEKTYNYPIKCQCHSVNHVETIYVCSSCKNAEPTLTTVIMRTKELKRLTPSYYIIPMIIAAVCLLYFFVEYDHKMLKEKKELEHFTDSLINAKEDSMNQQILSLKFKVMEYETATDIIAESMPEAYNIISKITKDSTHGKTKDSREN